MIELGYEPGIWTWNVILHGLCQQNVLDDAMHLVETMSARSDAKPNVVTLNTHWFVVGVRKVTWRWQQRSLSWLPKMKCGSK